MFYSIEIGIKDRQYDLQAFCLTDNFLPLRVFIFNSVRQRDEKDHTTLHYSVCSSYF